MELSEFLSLVNRKKKTIFLIVLVFLLATGVMVFSRPLNYEAKSKLLIVQDFNGNIDPYTAAKSNEFLSNILASVMPSDIFFQDVMAAGFNIKQNYFPQKAFKKMKLWEETIDANAVNDSGIIVVSVYHPDRYQLEQIARAVNYVLKTKNNKYHGGGDKVSVKTIDEPIISNWPTKPNIPLNSSLALLLGLVFSLSYIYLFPEEKFDLRLWPKRKKVQPTQNTNVNDNWNSIAKVLEQKPEYHDENNYSERNYNNQNNFQNRQTPQSQDIRERGSMRNILN